MKMRTKVIFFVALSVCVLAFPSVHAATANAPASLTPANPGTNVNLNATMTRLFGDPVIAKGKGFEIKQSELDDAMAGIKSAAAERKQTIPPHQLKLIEGEMLNRLIEVQLLLQKATPADKAAGEKMADSQMKALEKRAGSKEALQRQFSVLGMSMSKLRKNFEQEGTAQAALERELKIKVTDAEAKQFYNDHPGEFELPQRVRIEQIFFSTHDPVTGAELSAAQKAAKKKEAEDVLKRARSGANFEKLVKQYSDDPTSKENGGEYVIARGQTPPKFEAAVFSLSTNQISDLLTTPSGYHIVKLLEKLPAKMLAYDTVAARLKRVLIQQKASKQAGPYLTQLWKKYDVQIVDPDLKAVVQAEEAQMSTNAPAAPSGK